MGKTLDLKPVDGSFSLKEHIYDVLKTSIMNLDIYEPDTNLRMDERTLADRLGISRTPIREAIMRLEQEGFVEIAPRRGVFIKRKSLDEILELITVWAALESMAARLVTLHASDEEIASLREMFATFEGSRVRAKIDEYSETNIKFHQAILRLSRCELLEKMAENLFIHMRWLRMRTIQEGDRANRSIIDHLHIIEALEARETETVERLVRQHTLDLGAHVERNVQWLD